MHVHIFKGKQSTWKENLREEKEQYEEIWGVNQEKKKKREEEVVFLAKGKEIMRNLIRKFF